MRSPRLGGLFVAVALTVCSCRFGSPVTHPTPSPTLDPALVARARAASDILAHITLTSQPSQPVVNQDVTLHVHITNSQGNVTRHQPVEVKAQPVGTDRGGITASAKEAVNGDYIASFKPAIAGKWTVTVRARAGGFVKTKDFDLDVKPTG